MNREETKQMTEAAIKDLAQQLEGGHSEQLKAYLDVMARFHRYSFGNVILIAVQMPEASHVAGFHAWRKLGRWVRKGEKGIAILAPMVCRCKRDQETIEEPTQDPDQASKRLAGFRVVHVFDVSQTEGAELPQFARVQGQADEILAKLKGMVAGHGITLEYTRLLMGVHGASAGGKILLRPGLAAPETFAVLVHEFSHELLHKHERRAGATVIETEAEAIAYVVCRAMGLDPTTASSDYIQLYHGNQQTLMASLEVIQQTASRIIAGLSD